jgi:hypothetical protein
VRASVNGLVADDMTLSAVASLARVAAATARKAHSPSLLRLALAAGGGLRALADLAPELAGSSFGLELAAAVEVSACLVCGA